MGSRGSRGAGEARGAEDTGAEEWSSKTHRRVSKTRQRVLKTYRQCPILVDYGL
ncbi:hypothetical protein [uncultured Nostoc sp.]|uniref:hypothetical protein n=1 Tax=uncultured Nostoc sp. TaxID=340711 RepID=UPI00260325D3|nr:hypothetical protein [uncultured Nostoc sp.]